MNHRPPAALLFYRDAINLHQGAFEHLSHHGYVFDVYVFDQIFDTFFHLFNRQQRPKVRRVDVHTRQRLQSRIEVLIGNVRLIIHTKVICEVSAELLTVHERPCHSVQEPIIVAFALMVVALRLSLGVLLCVSNVLFLRLFVVVVVTHGEGAY